MKRFIFLLILLFVCIPLEGVSAFEFKSGNSVRVNKQVNGSAFFAGKSIVIEGSIDGDVYCAGQDIRINAQVTGDILCAGQYITIDNNVDGDIRAAGQIVSIGAPVEGGITLAGQIINIMSGADIRKDAVLAAQTIDIDGAIARDVLASAEDITISGNIGRNVQLAVHELILEDSAQLEGDIVYMSNQDADISPQSTVSGTIIRKEPEAPSPEESKSGPGVSKAVTSGIKAASFVSHLIFGALLVLFFPKLVVELIKHMRTNQGIQIAWGFLMTILIPIVIVLLFISILGIPFAFLIILLFVLAYFISKILVSLVVGKMLLERFYSEKKNSLWWSLGIGVFALWILFTIPFIGWIFSIFAVWWGLGAIFTFVRSKRAA